MSWILWVLISLVGVVAYINIGHFYLWVFAKHRWGGEVHWLRMLTIPAPASFGINGWMVKVKEFSDRSSSALEFNNWEDFYKSEKSDKERWGMIILWPLIVVVVLIVAIIDWASVILRIPWRIVKFLWKGFMILWNGLRVSGISIGEWIKKVPQTKTFKIVFNGDWLK
jgi:hypothetical protein